MVLRDKKIISSLVFASCVMQANSQGMNSPYSVYGIGDIDHKVYNRSSGMAGTSLALKSSSYLINTNPASITGLDRSFFVMNIATTGKTSTYKGDAIDANNNTNKDFWVKGVSLGTKINKVWASNIGFGQFSNVNYKFTGSKVLEGSGNIYATSYAGDGGLNEFYWNNAISIGQHFPQVLKHLISGALSTRRKLYMIRVYKQRSLPSNRIISAIFVFSMAPYTIRH